MGWWWWGELEPVLSPLLAPRAAAVVLGGRARGSSVPGGSRGARLTPAAQPPAKPDPGVVIVICLFVCVLVGGAAILLVWLCRRRTPGFHHLDEVPMVRGGGGRGAAGGAVGPGCGCSPCSLSSLEQGDRRVPHHPPGTQLTPPPQPPRLPTRLNKEAAALALVSRLSCALLPTWEKNPGPKGEALTVFGVPHTGLETLGCP